jgi:hypothetical protein
LLVVNPGPKTKDRRPEFNSKTMWDRKRQLTWLAAGLILGTYVSYSDSLLEDGTFVPRFFIFMESMVLLIIAALFYLYSRKKG